MAKKQQKKKERTYPKRKVKLIFDAVAEGKSLRKAAKEQEVSHSSVLRWCLDFPEVANQYAHACEARTKGKLERLQELYELAHEAAECMNGNLQLQAIKIEIDSTKWEMSKLLPAFGDCQHVRVEHKQGKQNEDVETIEEKELRQLAELSAALMAQVESEDYEQARDSH
ncbi:hypothetical protein [Fibrobacter sp.]|uniref:terminase small subunit-like protein n=1 Tax=Fibrobacter sp. TaxID=35828 RepID=UPI0025C087CB|nr:hypothetical protein [Fibrobacter sp.]MBR4007847.1 hypothetical protein [Fibrobacter sp.]